MPQRLDSDKLVAPTAISEQAASSGFRAIDFADVPSRPELERLTLELLGRGLTNSDRMREETSRSRKLIFTRTTRSARGCGTDWNATPSGKFINEHAFVLKDLVERNIIENITDKEYRLRR